MKKNVLLLLIPVLIQAQNVAVLTAKTNGLVYSTVTNRIYASMTSENGVNSNSLAVINTSSAALENAHPIGTNPTVLAIDNEGQRIFCGFQNDPFVKRFDLQNNSVTQTIPLGSDAINGNFYAEDIVVMPENSNTIAVARRNLNFAPKHEGVAVFDDGIMRTSVSAAHSGGNQIEIGNTKLIGFNNETTEFGIRRFTVDATGISAWNTKRLAEIKGNLTFKVWDDMAYFSNGMVVDVASSPIFDGTLENVNGPMVYDANENLICYADYSIITGEITLKRFNPTGHALVDSFPITQVTGVVKSMTICGAGCYAFNTENSIVVFNMLLGTDAFATGEKLSLYPNPANDKVNVVCEQPIQQVLICNAIGQVVKQIVVSESSDLEIHIGDLQTGTYLVKFESGQAQITKKLIKL